MFPHTGLYVPPAFHSIDEKVGPSQISGRDRNKLRYGATEMGAVDDTRRVREHHPPGGSGSGKGNRGAKVSSAPTNRGAAIDK